MRKVLLIPVLLFIFSNFLRAQEFINNADVFSGENEKNFSINFGMSYQPFVMNVYDSYNRSNQDFFSSNYTLFSFGVTYKPWLVNYLYFSMGLSNNEIGSGFNMGFGIGRKGTIRNKLTYRLLYEFALGPSIDSEMEYDSFYYSPHFTYYDMDNAGMLMLNHKIMTGIAYRIHKSLRIFLDIGYILYSDPTYTFLTNDRDEDREYVGKQVSVEVPENKMRYQIKDVSSVLFRTGLEFSLGI